MSLMSDCVSLFNYVGEVMRQWISSLGKGKRAYMYDTMDVRTGKSSQNMTHCTVHAHVSVTIIHTIQYFLKDVCSHVQCTRTSV